VGFGRSRTKDANGLRREVLDPLCAAERVTSFPCAEYARGRARASYSTRLGEYKGTDPHAIALTAKCF
jgi:hypothetical protein